MKRILPALDKLKYFTKRERYSDGWSEMSPYGREWEDGYRSRWQHDKVVRSTHGVVPCSSSRFCS
ncbi:hypothetical protein LOK74_04460 [Brevibacillus humidisoli]|uniref:hypothetical protein n=1 Tax=Brevibacillus humidisoli TaxID=2895522 RepID=UPI001E30B2AD|nr:hypothetical protein [Brevibacillus humidisoli]UFJ43215.1 hypothetical protein LOK74_04460 [Brevibacillus humidisoli]